MTPLEAEIRRRIRETGPIGVDEYMALCLSHPAHGYYMAREPFGRGGDFVTAPEVSQMFGELLGAWVLDAWTRLGAPSGTRLVELGPGRGTLMADALRVLARAPTFLRAATLHLVETSPRLREVQAATLRGAPLTPQWHDAVETVPDGPALILANEVFDALPVEQWVRDHAGWRRRVVTLAGDRLAFTLDERPCAEPGAIPARLRDAPLGAIVETSPSRLALARALARRVAEGGGAALVIDYGHLCSGPGDTLQAVRAHAFAAPLENPGLADLTAHVDFEALGEAAREAGAQAYGPVEQGEFLRALGIEARAARLRGGATSGRARAVDAAVERLTAAHAMGRLFKVMAMAGPGLVPAPFAPAPAEVQHA